MLGLCWIMLMRFVMANYQMHMYVFAKSTLGITKEFEVSLCQISDIEEIVDKVEAYQMLKETFQWIRIYLIGWIA